LPALPLNENSQARALDLDVPVSQRRQAERAVLLRVLGVADAHERGLEQPDDGGDHLAPREALELQVLLDLLPDRRERLGEGGHAAVLRLVAHVAPPGVIAVLLPAARVAARRLQVSVGEGTNPDLGPGRRDRELANTLELTFVGDRLAVGHVVGEPVPVSLARNAGPRVADVPEPGRAGRRGRFRDGRCRLDGFLCHGDAGSKRRSPRAIGSQPPAAQR
jgi:hypothetical protein